MYMLDLLRISKNECSISKNCQKCELTNERCPEHLNMGTARMNPNYKNQEKSKQTKENMNSSKTYEQKTRRPN